LRKLCLCGRAARRASTATTFFLVLVLVVVGHDFDFDFDFDFDLLRNKYVFVWLLVTHTRVYLFVVFWFNFVIIAQSTYYDELYVFSFGGGGSCLGPGGCSGFRRRQA